ADTFFFFQAEDGIRDFHVTGVQTCALPIFKQVMIELDPSFDERTLGYSKFSRFLIEAANRGCLRLRKLENGQYEVAPADTEVEEPAPEEEEQAAPRARREEGSRRGRRDREERAAQRERKREERPSRRERAERVAADQAPV